MSDNLIFMFSGQGSQYVGMGKELYENYDAAKKVLDEADQILDFDLKDMIFNGPEEDLNNTKNTQPAIYTVSAMVKAVLNENGFQASAAAGHSPQRCRPADRPGRGRRRRRPTRTGRRCRRSA